ncbi:hypothetical protein BJV78DRAFT_1244671 [Lactifluus subvellereus]|nr:hypothetical protein BJV78DRAFT_1244671 [Lactifluus subvellereus]
MTWHHEPAGGAAVGCQWAVLTLTVIESLSTTVKCATPNRLRHRYGGDFCRGGAPFGVRRWGLDEIGQWAELVRGETMGPM